ncbi:hypothetical protein [Actinomadura terrae]|uniref:hypothetical protein n=1 Tax=Actinomadura terrae TaxID=604353 RepID=UPI001FA7F54D|nr:hypothetical protein [Actinomadura terrae]
MSTRTSEHPPRTAAWRGRAAAVTAASGALAMAATVLPAAVMTVPDTTANVAPAAAEALGLGTGDLPDLLRATGLSLPALLLAVPLAAVAARRFSACSVAASGLLVLLAGIGAARLAGSVAQAGLVRAMEGAGAGVVLPASLVLIWERRSRALAALWAGGLVCALLMAMPVALRLVPVSGGTAAGGAGWRAALAPTPWPAIAAIAAVALFLFLRGRGPWRLPAPRHSERGRLVLPLVPAAGFAFLAVIAADAWSPGARLAVGALALPALVALALAGGADPAAGSPHGCAVVMIAVGLLGYPVAAPLAGLAAVDAHARGAAGASLLPFALAGAAAIAGALASVRARPRAAVLTGYCLMLAAPLLGLAADHTFGGLAGRAGLLAVLIPLGAGAGLALAASLRDAGAGAALFGLALLFPAVLAGQLMVLSLQTSWLVRARPVTQAQQLDALTGGYQAWLGLAAASAVLLAAVTARAGARAADRSARADAQATGRALAGSNPALTAADPALGTAAGGAEAAAGPGAG